MPCINERHTCSGCWNRAIPFRFCWGFFAGVDGCVDGHLLPCSRSHNLLRKVKPQFLRWSFGAPSIHYEPAGDIPSTFQRTFFSSIAVISRSVMYTVPQYIISRRTRLLRTCTYTGKVVCTTSHTCCETVASYLVWGIYCPT